MTLPELRIKDRNGKASLWIGNENVWDLSHEHVCDRVLDAIRSAYEMGREDAISDVRKIETRFRNYIWTDNRSDESRKTK